MKVLLIRRLELQLMDLEISGDLLYGRGKFVMRDQQHGDTFSIRDTGLFDRAKGIKNTTRLKIYLPVPMNFYHNKTIMQYNCYTLRM